MLDKEQEVKISFTIEQVEIIIDLLNSTSAEDLYGDFDESLPGFLDSKDYQMEMLHRILEASL